jgi:hypothetical protein
MEAWKHGEFLACLRAWCAATAQHVCSHIELCMVCLLVCLPAWLLCLQPHLNMPPVATTISGPQQQPAVAAAAVGDDSWQQQEQCSWEQGEQQLGVQLLRQQLAANQQQAAQESVQQQQQWQYTSSSSSRAQPAPVVAAATYTSDTETDEPDTNSGWYAEEQGKTPPVYVVLKLKGGRVSTAVVVGLGVYLHSICCCVLWQLCCTCRWQMEQQLVGGTLCCFASRCPMPVFSGNITAVLAYYSIWLAASSTSTTY